MKWQDNIVSNNNILLGKPVIRGTRISVEFILDHLANCWSEQDLLDNYPNISRGGISASVDFNQK